MILHNVQKCHFTSSRVGAFGQSGVQGGKLTSEFSFSIGIDQSNTFEMFFFGSHDIPTRPKLVIPS